MEIFINFQVFLLFLYLAIICSSTNANALRQPVTPGKTRPPADSYYIQCTTLFSLAQFLLISASLMLTCSIFRLACFVRFAFDLPSLSPMSYSQSSVCNFYLPDIIHLPARSYNHQPTHIATQSKSHNKFQASMR